MIDLLTFLAEAADSAADAVSGAEHEPTLGDTVQEIVSKPEETFSILGQFFEKMWNSILNAIPTILFAILVLVIGIIFTKLSLKLLSRGLKRSKLELTVTKFTSQMVKIVLYTLLVTIVLNILGVPATSIIAVIGTAGVAIGLALQSSLSNVAGGFLLMISKPFKVGDYIVSNGVEGTVSSISIIHTRLETHTNQAVFIPNGLAINATVVNNTCNDTRRVDVTFSISYNDDFPTAQKIILSVMDAHPMVLKDKAPAVRMIEHGASGIIITARAWCKTPDYWDVFFDLTEQVCAAFIENNIEIPFNQLDVHMIENK